MTSRSFSPGTQTGRSLQAAFELKSEGISAAMPHIPSIKPLDEEAIIEAARIAGAIVTAEDNHVYDIGGSGEEDCRKAAG